MELDDWDLTAEELDALERDAIRQISHRHASPPRSSSAASPRHTPQKQQQRQFDVASAADGPSFDLSPAKQLADIGRNKVEGSPGPRTLPTSVAPEVTDDHLKELPKVKVKFILHASGNIAVKFPYDQLIVNAVRGVPKASWNAKERLWIFPMSSLPSAEKALGALTAPKVEVENLDPFVRRAISAAASVPDLRDQYDKIPDDLELKLLPFQRDGIRFVLQHGGRALLADEMGLGKTLQAIAVTACVRESWPVLVLTPSSLRLQWASMIQQWLNIPASDIVVVLSQWGGSNKSGFTIVSSTKGSVHLDGLFNIISYDSVPKLQNALMTSEFKVVIADESHYLKNAQAKRTNASLPVLRNAQYTILLSGTPALSRPIELFKQLEALCPQVYKNVHEYGNRYCKGSMFGLYQGSSNHEELHNLIKATVMIRRLKKDVLSELPQKRRQQVFLDLAEKDMRQINALFHEVEVVKQKVKAAKSAEEVESLKFTEKHLINKLYKESADAKVPAVVDYLGTVIEAGCKILIFAHHQFMIDSVHRFLQKKKVGCIRIDGTTPAASRQALVADFQDNDMIKAAVLSIKAGGVGLTLTAASTVIFTELSWTPGDLIQAEDRAHRIGQVSSVNVYYLLANDTVDDIIWDVVQSKLENLGQVLDGHENVMEVAGGSRPVSSPAKQTTLDSFVKRCNSSPVAGGSRPVSSPAKQTTLDSFVKRCNSRDGPDAQLKLKFPRH